MAMMGEVLLTFMCVFLCLFITVDSDKKYTREMNEFKEDLKKMERPFRSNKVNLVWEKAQKKLNRDKLADLYPVLKKQDTDEIHLKKMIADGLDEDGERSAQLAKRMRKIMHKFNLADHFEENNTLDEGENPLGDIPVDEIKMNTKLKKLWKKAKHAGFSREEMEKLKQEFLHHQMKVDEYYQLKSELDQHEDIENESVDEIKSNEVDGYKKKHLNSNLKRKHKDLKQDLERLELLTRQKEDKYDFKDPKVVELLAMAKKANFTEEELVSFKEELSHFEHKINKHKVFQTEADMMVKNYKAKGKELPTEHAKMEDRIEKYGRKLKKYQSELQHKVEKAMLRHNEL